MPPLKGAISGPELWAARLEIPSRYAESYADILDETALSLAILSLPRSAKTQIEAIYEGEPDRAVLTARLAVVSALNHAKPPKLDIGRIPSLDWIRKVAADFPPLPIARWIIHGAHYRHAIPDRRRALQIDATSAFGTGEHPTTKGCLLMLDKVLKKGGGGRRMLDMGCGTGILAMAWAKAHSGKALGVDCDARSVRIARDNAAVNGLQGRIHIRQGLGYGGREVRRHAPYDVIMANIFARPLAAMAKDVKRNLRPGGTAILSGLLTRQANLVLSAHRMHKIYAAKCFRTGEWSMLVLTKKGAKAS